MKAPKNFENLWPRPDVKNFDNVYFSIRSNHGSGDLRNSRKQVQTMTETRCYVTVIASRTANLCCDPPTEQLNCALHLHWWISQVCDQHYVGLCLPKNPKDSGPIFGDRGDGYPLPKFHAEHCFGPRVNKKHDVRTGLIFEMVDLETLHLAL